MAVITIEQREAAIAKALQDVSHIATLPEVAVKIIEIVEDPTSTAQDLHKVITNDPALCSRILKVVNSAFYGLPGQIGSINRAIVLLGLNAVKNIAIATSLAKLFRGGDLCPRFSAKTMWVHSVGSAAACKLIVDHAGIGLADEAFLAGLIHDIGFMVEMQSNRNGLIQVFDRHKPGMNFLQVEEDVFGANHQDFGRGLCEKWKFPKSFGYVTGYHHRPLELASGTRTLACVVHVADRLALQAKAGFGEDIDNAAMDPSVLDELNLGEAELKTISEELPAGIDQVQAMLS